MFIRFHDLILNAICSCSCCFRLPLVFLFWKENIKSYDVGLYCLYLPGLPQCLCIMITFCCLSQGMLLCVGLFNYILQLSDIFHPRLSRQDSSYNRSAVLVFKRSIQTDLTRQLSGLFESYFVLSSS